MPETEQDLELMSEEEAEAFNKPPEEEVAEQPEKVEAEPEKVEPEPEVKPEEKLEEEQKPEGILAKDGKNVIPFSVLEEERTKRQALESEIAELKKVKQPPPEPVAEPKPKPDFKIDSKALASKLYESAEGAEEVLATLAKKIEEAYDAGRVAATEAATTATTEVEFQKEIEKIKAENPWIPDSKGGEPSLIETTLFNLALKKMEAAGIKQTDVKGMVRVAREAVAEGKILFKVDQPSVTEAAIVEREKKARDAAIKEVLAKFNIKEPDAVTLANLRSASSSSVTRLDDIDKLSGLDYEEAFSQLTPEERETVLRRDIAPAKL